MKILHINTSDISGGAARAAYRLHEGLRKDGHSSRILGNYILAHDPDTASIHDSLVARAATRVTAAVMDRFSRQDVYYPLSKRLFSHPWFQEADVIQLHNLHGSYFPFTLLPHLSARKPVAWMLHDMWSLTGHCGYSYTCNRWQTGCGSCPQLGKDYLPLRRDTTAWHWRKKDKAYAESVLQIAAPSSWLAQCAADSPLLNRFPIHHIPYGIDLDVYKPISKEVARQMLELPQGAVVLLFSAHILENNPRKGAGFLREALGQLKRAGVPGFERLHLLLLGQDCGKSQMVEGVPSTSLGYVEHDYMLRATYCAADVYIMPSLADNLPLSIMEALACEVPVLAFDSGGIRDLVINEQTGRLVPAGNSEALVEGLRDLLSAPEAWRALGAGGRRHLQERCALPVHVRRMTDLYEGLITATL